MATNQDNLTAEEVADAAESEEFGDAFAEAAAARSAPADDAAADDQAADDDDGNADDPPADAEAPAQPDQPATPPADQSDDIWKDAPPHLRAAYEREKRDADHRIRSVTGRVSALDRELQQVRQQRQSGAQGQQQEQPQADKPAADDLLASDGFKAFQEEFPEVATPVTELFKAMQAKLDALTGTVGTVAQDRDLAAYAANAATLTEQHPDWLEIATKDDRFYGWLETQPQSIKDAAQRNWQHVVDPADAAIVFERFKAQVGQQTPSPAPTPTADTAAKRARQLATGRTATTKTPSIAAEEPDDFDAAFTTAARKLDAKRQAQLRT